jgi:hypothetical protein
MSDLFPASWAVVVPIEVATAPVDHATGEPAGDAGDVLAVPALRPMETEPVTATVEPDVPAETVLRTRSKEPVDLLICDQEWMARLVGTRRLDLLALRQGLSDGRTSYLVGSQLDTRSKFQRAAEARGWASAVAESRADLIREVEVILERHLPTSVAVVSGHRDILDLVSNHGCRVEQCTDLAEYFTD